VASIWITPRCIAGFNAVPLKAKRVCAGLGNVQQVAGVTMIPISKCVVDGFISTGLWMSKGRQSIPIFHRHGIQKQQAGFLVRR
jgi:hypothetical protein